MHKGCLKHGTHHKAYKLCIKHNPKSLQKQHGYKPEEKLNNNLKKKMFKLLAENAQSKKCLNCLLKSPP